MRVERVWLAERRGKCDYLGHPAEEAEVKDVSMDPLLVVAVALLQLGSRNVGVLTEVHQLESQTVFCLEWMWVTYGPFLVAGMGMDVLIAGLSKGARRHHSVGWR